MLDTDLTINLVHTTYLTFAHNYVLLSYVLGLMVSIIVAIKRPSRFALLLILGFLILSFSFTYDKHIAVGLREQTIRSLIRETPHQRAEALISSVLSELLPILFYACGWFLIYLAILIGGWKRKTN